MFAELDAVSLEDPRVFDRPGHIDTDWQDRAFDLWDASRRRRCGADVQDVSAVCTQLQRVSVMFKGVFRAF